MIDGTCKYRSALRTKSLFGIVRGQHFDDQERADIFPANLAAAASCRESRRYAATSGSGCGQPPPVGNENAGLVVTKLMNVGIDIRVAVELPIESSAFWTSTFRRIRCWRHVELPINEFVFVARLIIRREKLVQRHRPAMIGRSRRSTSSSPHLRSPRIHAFVSTRSSRGSGKLTCSSRTVRVSTSLHSAPANASDTPQPPPPVALAPAVTRIVSLSAAPA